MDVLKRARVVLAERGWCLYYSAGHTSELNVPSAVATATTALVGTGHRDWYPLYVEAVAVLRNHLGQGVQYWEYGPGSASSPTRTEREVLAMLDEVIAGACRRGKKRKRV